MVMARNPNQSLTTRARRTQGSSQKADSASSYPSSDGTIGDDDTVMTNSSSNREYPTPSSLDNSQTTATSSSYQIPDSSSSAIHSLGRDSTKLLDAINQIALLGIDSKTLELPKIVTIGDQSAGKSSAIAALSGITVPRKAGTCTRVRDRDSLHDYVLTA